MLHDVTRSGPCVYLITPKDCTSAANSLQGGKVYLKVVPIAVRHGTTSLQTYTILDDGAERTSYCQLRFATWGSKAEQSPSPDQGEDGSQSHATLCYYTTYRPITDDIYQHVECLWQLNVLRFRGER